MKKRALIDKVDLLESKLGNNRPYKLLEPFKFDCSDPNELQKAGKRIAAHLGLNSLIFVIYFSRTDQKIAGSVNLNPSDEVFIEISDKYRYDPQVVLSILAHEICHKFLYFHNIQLFPEIENEILTDVTTIYTGLGKLSLNGCEKVIEHIIVHHPKTVRKIIIKVGYLSSGQFAFVYKLMSRIKAIPYTETLTGLSTRSLKAYKNADDTESEVPGSWSGLFELIYKSFAYNYRFIRQYISE